MKLLTLIRYGFLQLKIARRIHAYYPTLFAGSRILSLLPPEVEKLIKPGTVIEENVLLPAGLKEIGRYVYIGRNAYISSCARIGAFTSISAGVRIGLMSHPDDWVSTSPAFYAKRRGLVNENTYAEDEGKQTVIGADVLISANALIRNGVTVGHGAIVGAGAFVNDDVPPYAVVAGVPARIIRYRFDEEMRNRLLHSEWWLKPDAELLNAGNFNNPDAFLQRLENGKA
ncbi:MAG: CatB-related O-acetyltransferase [Bacteroidetes bacterium]|nr:CatB-related O-acetyltransferase [Bacteroidota bacterium]